MSAGSEILDAIIVFFATSFGVEIAPSTTAGIVGPRAVYRWTWWVSPVAVAGGGVYVALAIDGLFPVILAWLGGAVAVASAIVFRLHIVPAGSQEVRRHAIIRDRNRAERIIGLCVAGATIVLAAVLG